ncbi:MAG: TetR/AcrR family transcriptional regulator [Moraxellaceae bacterium]
MARNKREQDRDSKRDEIIASARQLFLEDGYEATAMSRLAATAGVAPNTIYWYFKDKDEVLVAVLDAEFTKRAAEYLERHFTDSAERLLWIVNQLELTSRLVSTVHSRVAISPQISAWHDRFHALSEGMIRLELAQKGLAPERIEPLVKICVFAIEGLLAHPMSDAEKRSICATLGAI